MPKYRVYLIAPAEVMVEVEAEDGDTAVDIALNGDLPYASAFAGFDLGQWTTPSEMFPNQKPENDYEEIAE